MFLRAATLALLISGSSAMANEYSEALTDLAQSQLSAWVADPALVAAIRSQNEENAGLTESAIITLDKQWRAEVGQSNAPLINQVLTSDASEYLRAKKEESAGIVTEVFVMDNKGLNVAQSDVTSDFWQGDEAKWSDSFGAGANGFHIGEVELDDSTQQYQSQISMAIVDPENGTPIGAITFGINLEMLE